VLLYNLKKIKLSCKLIVTVFEISRNEAETAKGAQLDAAYRRQFFVFGCGRYSLQVADITLHYRFGDWTLKVRVNATASLLYN